MLKKKADPIWHEGHPYPRDVDYMVTDTLESLRPKLTVFTNLEEAMESLNKLNKEHKEQIGWILLPCSLEKNIYFLHTRLEPLLNVPWVEVGLGFVNN